LTLRILRKLVRKKKLLKINLKHINKHSGAHLKTLVPNTFPLTKGHCHYIQDKIKTDVLNITHPIENPTISARTKGFFITK
jgi:hypothetical protein